MATNLWFDTGFPTLMLMSGQWTFYVHNSTWLIKLTMHRRKRNMCGRLKYEGSPLQWGVKMIRFSRAMNIQSSIHGLDTVQQRAWNGDMCRTLSNHWFLEHLTAKRSLQKMWSFVQSLLWPCCTNVSTVRAYFENTLSHVGISGKLIGVTVDGPV